MTDATNASTNKGGNAIDIESNFNGPATHDGSRNARHSTNHDTAPDVGPESGASAKNDAKPATPAEPRPAATKANPGKPKDPADTRPETQREIKAVNPLLRFARTGQIYVELPSRGRWGNPETAAASGLAGQIEVQPMTTRDDANSRNPSALVNGEAVRSLLQSCAGIENPEDLVKNDIDFLLVAIAYATHGDDYTFQVQCGSDACKTKAKEDGTAVPPRDMTVKLSGIIESRNEDFFDEDGRPKVFDVELPSGAVVRMGPRTYKADQEIAMRSFEDMSKYNAMMAQGRSELEQMRALGDSVMSQIAITIDALADSIDFVQVPGETEDADAIVVTDKAHIAEWLKDLSKPHFDKIIEMAADIGDIGFKHKATFECPDCGTKSEMTIPFDMTNFFGRDS